MTRHTALDVFVVRKLRLAPASLVVAVPPGSPASCREFTHTTDEIVCASALKTFAAFGPWYDDSRQTADTHVHELLRAAESPELAGKPQ